jgi:hypothetical protein
MELGSLKNLFANPALSDTTNIREGFSESTT